MKIKIIMKIKIALLTAVLFVTLGNAQIYTPNGMIQGVTSNNNIGIGTSTPNSQLSLTKVSSILGDPQSISLYEDNLANYGFGVNAALGGMDFCANQAAAGTSFRWYGGTNKTTPKQLMALLGNGNLGIGTATPEAKLDVNGAIQINGGANNFYGFGQSSSSKPVDIRLGFHYPYVFNWHEGLTFSAHSSYGGIRFYNQGYPDMYGAGVMVMSITNNNVGIGTTNPTSKLTVAGNINAREVKVTVDAGADFVFENDYNLPSLDSVGKFIKENKHLPEIASADEMKKDGINLSEMNIKLLQKIEELTLYTIEQQKNTEKLARVIETLTKRLEFIEIK